MAQQNVYEIGGSTDAITFYSSTQYGPPIGVDLNTGQQQMGNQIASQNIKGPLDLIGIIEQASANSVAKIGDYIRQWSTEAGQAYQNFRQAQDANTEQQLGTIRKNLERGAGAVNDVIGLTDNYLDTVTNVARRRATKQEGEIPFITDLTGATSNRQTKTVQSSGISNTFEGFENSLNRQYERVTTGYESQLLDQWQNPTLEPGWKSSDPYDPNVYKQLPKYRVSGASTSGTLYTGR